MPGESFGTIRYAGSVNVLYGSKSGLTGKSDQVWHQDVSGIDGRANAEDYFGTNLTAGDFNGDGRDDLAVGLPTEYVGSSINAGFVNVIYGGANGLTAVGDQMWHQDSAGVPNTAEANDKFGFELAAGDFNGDGYEDLVASAPEEDSNAGGVVTIIYGSKNKLTDAGSTELSPAILGYMSYVGAYFGASLAVGDFNGDGKDDLAIGAGSEKLGNILYVGAAYVVYGGSDGLEVAGRQKWNQDSVGIPDATEEYDSFGGSLATGDYNGDGYVDLAIGVPGESFTGAQQAGAVQVLYGFFFEGLTDDGNRFWYQGLLGASDGDEFFDNFGGVLA